ncbi:PHF5 family protein [Abortiporus biennis]
MSKHHPDLIMCRRQPGIAIGRLCEKCDGKCPVCDSYVRPETLVRICDECNFGTYGGRCIICGSPGISDAYYCAECTRLEKDRDGCPKIVNLGASRTDLFYERRRLGFKKALVMSITAAPVQSIIFCTSFLLRKRFKSCILCSYGKGLDYHHNPLYNRNLDRKR